MNFNLSPEQPNTKLTKKQRSKIFKRAHHLSKGNWFNVPVKFYKGQTPTFGECLSFCYREVKLTNQKKVEKFNCELNKIKSLYEVKQLSKTPDQLLEIAFSRGECIYCDGY